MSAAGYNKSPTACQKKWNNLKIRYRSIKDNMGKSGAGRTTWVYFDKMNEILHQDRSTEPAATSSSYNNGQSATPKRKEDKSQTETCTKKQKKTNKQMPGWFEDYLKEQKEDRDKEREEMRKFREDIVKNMGEKNSILRNLTEILSKSLK
ncbi:uncharacterized protein LOC134262565 [Saccostrea cucullata]|uniref:uncharacterized protein LOC134262565 n=1 Tax=Saccostrea cuccullata TaxID=36930 RepID=UPI002ED5E206